MQINFELVASARNEYVS